MTRVVVASVTGVHVVSRMVVTGMHVMPGMSIVARVHVMPSVPRPRPVIVLPIVFATGMTDLSFADQVVRLVTLALVWRAVAFAAWVVVALAHEPRVISVGRAVFFVLVGVV